MLLRIYGEMNGISLNLIRQTLSNLIKLHSEALVSLPRLNASQPRKALLRRKNRRHCERERSNPGFIATTKGDRG